MKYNITVACLWCGQGSFWKDIWKHFSHKTLSYLSDRIEFPKTDFTSLSVSSYFTFTFMYCIYLSIGLSLYLFIYLTVVVMMDSSDCLLGSA